MSKSIKTAVCALAFGAALVTTQAQAQGTFADRALTKIVGHWEANDLPVKGRLVKFYISDGNASFEDWVEPGVNLTGSFRQDNEGADYVLNYSRGYQCRYTVSMRGYRDKGDATLTFRLVGTTNPDKEGRFRCFEGRLEQVQQKSNS